MLGGKAQQRGDTGFFQHPGQAQLRAVGQARPDERKQAADDRQFASPVRQYPWPLVGGFLEPLVVQQRELAGGRIEQQVTDPAIKLGEVEGHEHDGSQQ
ncbi:hypothetical protein D9M73_229070 [compost metagenome]